MKKIIFILIFAMFVQSSLKADIAHFLDFKLILNESTAGKKAQNSLKSKLSKGMENIKSKEKTLLEEEKKLFNKKNSSNLKNIKKKLRN